MIDAAAEMPKKLFSRDKTAKITKLMHQVLNFAVTV